MKSMMLVIFGFSIALSNASAETVCGVFELNSYGQGCNDFTIYSGQCPTVGLSIWRGMAGRADDLTVVTDIANETAKGIENLKCICIDYHFVGSKWGSTMIGRNVPISAPRACGKSRHSYR